MVGNSAAALRTRLPVVWSGPPKAVRRSGRGASVVCIVSRRGLRLAVLLIPFCLSGCQSHRALRHPIGSKSGDQQYYNYLDLNLTNAEADANLFICCGNSGDLGRDKSRQALGCGYCEQELGGRSAHRRRGRARGAQWRRTRVPGNLSCNLCPIPLQPGVAMPASVARSLLRFLGCRISVLVNQLFGLPFYHRLFHWPLPPVI